MRRNCAKSNNRYAKKSRIEELIRRRIRSTYADVKNVQFFSEHACGMYCVKLTVVCDVPRDEESDRI